MICEHCGFPLARHVQHRENEDVRMCIGANNTYRARVDNVTATFIFKNTNGVGEHRDVVIMQERRPIARIENMIDQLLRQGNTDISVNISAS